MRARRREPAEHRNPFVPLSHCFRSLHPITPEHHCMKNDNLEDASINVSGVQMAFSMQACSCKRSRRTKRASEATRLSKSRPKPGLLERNCDWASIEDVEGRIKRKKEEGAETIYNGKDCI